MNVDGLNEVFRVGNDSTSTLPCRLLPWTSFLSMINLAVFFVQYDVDRYGGAYDRLTRLCSFSAQEYIRLFRIDNRLEGDWRKQAGSIIELGGDNSCHEFSAWDKALAVLGGDGIRARSLLFVTDAFSAYGDRYEYLFNGSVVDFLAREGAVGGLVDLPQEGFGELGLMGRRLSWWLRTSFFIVPGSVQDVLRSLVRIPSVEPFCDSTYTGLVFREDADMSLGYKAYLEDWLTRRWHSARPLSEENWPALRDKLRSILNEHLLSLELVERRIPIYDLRFLRRLRLTHRRPLAQISRDIFVPYSLDPIRQVRFPKPPLWVRLGDVLLRGRLWPRGPENSAGNG